MTERDRGPRGPPEFNPGLPGASGRGATSIARLGTPRSVHNYATIAQRDLNA